MAQHIDFAIYHGYLNHISPTTKFSSTAVGQKYNIIF